MAPPPAQEILRTRLFGYAVLFRARPRADGGFDPVDSGPGAAAALARELQLHLGQPVADGSRGADEVGISVPFGRCGLSGRPCEHVRLHHVEAAWLDELTPEGPRSRPVAEGETILVEPGRFVRFRARPRPGGRVLVAFQTEDHSPLHGHAAPLSLAGDTIPTEAGPRLALTTVAFQQLSADTGAAARRLAGLFEDMEARVRASAAVSAAQAAAQASGSYDAGGAPGLFDAARQLLTPAVIERVGAADPALFRYPGMFGAVAPLFPLLDEA